MKILISFIIRFKILHVFFWLMKYYLLVHAVLRSNKYKLQFPYLDVGIIIFGQLAAVYIINEYLLNKLFFRKKYASFLLTSIAICIILGFLPIIIQEQYTRLFVPGFHMRYLTTGIGNMVDTFIITIVFFVIYIAVHYYRRDRDNNTLIRQQLEAELNFLKAQLNPHFMFNTINSIYVQMDDDTIAARETLLQFSSLLRYQLYDCSATTTPVKKELRFIEDFIALNQVRYGQQIKVSYSWQNIPEQLEIAPLLLIPFVENAFKHIAMLPLTESIIDIAAKYHPGQLSFKIANTYNPSQQQQPGPGGVGLHNVRRRLELLYPSRFSLNITPTGNQYIVQLNIQLHEISLPHSR